MIRIVTTVLALALVTFPTHALATNLPSAGAACDLTEATAPSIRGVRLGMSTAQSLTLFPGARKRTEIEEAIKRIKAGTGEVVYLSFYPATDGAKDGFSGVESISVGVHDDRVVDFSVTYVDLTWRSIDEWVGKLSETLTLPDSQTWVVGPNESPNKVLKCRGIEIEAAIQGGGASIRVRNVEALKVVEAHHNAEEKREHRTFKP